jgi:hypothetical protein
MRKVTASVSATDVEQLQEQVRLLAAGLGLQVEIPRAPSQRRF